MFEGVESEETEPAGNARPVRRASTTQQVVRSTDVVEYVMRLHDHECQACGTRLTFRGRGYSEGAHIRAVGKPHNGPDVVSNVLCLCSNCHVLGRGTFEQARAKELAAKLPLPWDTKFIAVARSSILRQDTHRRR